MAKKKKRAKGVENKIESYFAKHVFANSFFHVCVGLGLGALLTHTIFDPHPVRWALVFLGISAFGHYLAWKNR